MCGQQYYHNLEEVVICVAINTITVIEGVVICVANNTIKLL